ncbi:DUF1269 domain-containing protein [Desulforhabdus amnigena]|uniref:DUF1269 domain-containing protein n=1 Tax=Desulforhabdus amnigena TaxID=40218 RepID=A0A9W6FUN5_9BACT|nr:DUF1269 domain-containing protein [Desulforhabdus amnigena]GLI35216.1 hypothetical protein DAMNIGENAA_26490 [Desulforhabdus amnigena]
MGHFADYASKRLGVRLPEEYAGFMENYGKRLSEDPIHKKSWLGGLGSPDFVIGTTLAFRSSIPKFSMENVVIGYVGVKTIIVNKAYEEIDEYLMLNTRDGSILAVDSFGATNRLAASFEEWVGPELFRARLREKYTSNLTVIVFDDELKAEEARLKLLKLQRSGFIDLEDAVVVVKEADGRVRYHQMHRPARKGGFAGSITGLIVGSILLSPLIGAVLGAVTGAVSASLTDVGVDDQFMKDLSEEFKPGSSALFTLVRRADPERVAEECFGFGGKVLMNSVSREREALIQAYLDGTAEGIEKKQ